MIRTGTRTIIACTAAASAVLLLTGSSWAGAANGDAVSSGLVGDLVGGAWALFPQFAALPASAGLNSPVLLHGRLTDPAGAPMAGAQVLLAAWPSNDTVHALPIGGRFSITPLRARWPVPTAPTSCVRC